MLPELSCDLSAYFSRNLFLEFMPGFNNFVLFSGRVEETLIEKFKSSWQTITVLVAFK